MIVSGLSIKRFQRVFIFLAVVLYVPGFGQTTVQPSSVTTSLESTFKIKIHPSLPLYLIHYYCKGVQDPDSRSTEITVVAAPVNNKKKTNTIRYIIPGLDALLLSVRPDDETTPHFNDINADGYKDMRLLDSKDDKGNFVYVYYVFNPKKMIFQRQR